ncbi:MAG TPA: glycoside-pentoside-hexuronide (GPH):cation symporter [Steroidobacteraceae bacterium]|nr:glycoside-pentoside-hexuronide (GPH):cation symporter [Steroidobacteraceae bacterium]
MAKQNLSTREKFGFGLGDMSSNIVYQAILNLLLYFYTDVYGITAASAALLFLVVRIYDAVIDPALGALADRTRSRHGRYRPWMLWIAVPYGVLAVAAFITPDVSMQYKVVYAYISYMLLVTAYSAINIPYSALGGAMTGDSEERANLQTWRFGLAMIGGFLVTTSVLPLARILGGGGDPENLRLGFPFAMGILATIAVVGFMGCFALTKERVHYDEDESRPKQSPWQDIKSMFTNSQWLIIGLVTLIIMTRGGIQGSAKAYFVDYYLVNNYGSVVSDNALITWLAGIFAVTENLIALFMGLTMLAGVGGVIVANRLIRTRCKVRIMQAALTGTLLVNVMLFFIPREWMLQALLLTMTANFFHMMFIPLLFSAVPDTVDFGIRTVGKGAMAMFCAGHLFVLSLGNALGGAAAAAILAAFGYVANTEQTPTALFGIKLAFAGSSIVGALLVIICLNWYRLTRGWQERIAPVGA